jgi:hypothetical protein
MKLLVKSANANASGIVQVKNTGGVLYSLSGNYLDSAANASIWVQLYDLAAGGTPAVGSLVNEQICYKGSSTNFNDLASGRWFNNGIMVVISSTPQTPTAVTDQKFRVYAQYV